MAKRIVIHIIDDLDGGPAQESITFGLDGVSYEIDLSEANADRMRQQLQTWIEHARRAGGRTAATTGGQGAKKNTARRAAELKDMRAYARQQGYTVSDRGRVPLHIEREYWDSRKA